MVRINFDLKRRDADRLALMEAALGHARAGRSVVPVFNKNAVVAWKMFQTRAPTEDNVKAWFGAIDGINQIAVVTGKINGVWVMDLDGSSALEWGAANAPGTPVRVRSGRAGGGEHWYYRIPDSLSVKNKANVLPELKARTGDQIDVRGEGGMAIIPPSAYDSAKGVYYEWIGAEPGEGDWRGLP